MKCPERIVVQEQREYEMLTAVHSDNASEYRPLLKQLLLAQPEHHVLERLGRSSPAIAQLAHRFLARFHISRSDRRGRVDDDQRSAHTGCIASHLFRQKLRGHPMKDSSDIPTIISAQNP